MKLKALTAAVLATALLSACGSSAASSAAPAADTSSETAASADNSGDLLAQIQQRGEIVFGTEGTWSPWTYHDENDQLVGFDIEVAQKVAEKLGVKATFVEGEWDGLLAGVDGGRYDSMANGVEITEERAQKYDFSDPYCYIRTAIIVKSDDDSINSFEDLNGKTTANTISSTYATLAESYGAKTTGVDDLNQTIELLLNGRSLGRKPCTEAQEYLAVFRFAYEPGTLEAVSYKNGVETGRDTLATASETAALRLTADSPAIAADGKDLCFVQIQCVDAAGNPVLADQREIKVELLGGGTLAALGTADPKPDRLLPFAGPVCPLYDGAAMAIIRSEGGAKGALLRVTLGDLVAELGIGFTPVAAQSLPVHEAAPSAADLPLGTLLENEKARAVLAKVLGPMLESPMLAQMKSMSLKKLLSMGGQTLPPEVLHALDAACAKE